VNPVILALREVLVRNGVPLASPAPARDALSTRHELGE
jgi:hypothetical protein